ncbi:MAG TPA: formate dehydrogenase accessory protein FdhE [Bryobacteraceae bacterium]|nr:formate dehydrogenase accessory protein FdhE [Bryobacteraceae bacterium]
MTRWDRRIERASELAQKWPSACEMLLFYRELVVFQRDLRGGPARAQLPALLDLVRQKGTTVLREAAFHLTAHSDEWDAIFTRRHDLVNAFFVRVIEQPYFERQAAQSKVNTTTVQSTCPFCSEKPIVAVLRPEGDGGRRTLLCGLCFTEWEFRRLLCPACGEEDREKLPVYTAADFPHIRVEACETCRHYIKAVDLTRDGTAVPEVDEIGALTLDLWAMEHDYTKLAPNLFG